MYLYFFFLLPRQQFFRYRTQSDTRCLSLHSLTTYTTLIQIARVCGRKCAIPNKIILMVLYGGMGTRACMGMTDVSHTHYNLSSTHAYHTGVRCEKAHILRHVLIFSQTLLPMCRWDTHEDRGGFRFDEEVDHRLSTTPRLCGGD